MRIACAIVRGRYLERSHSAGVLILRLFGEGALQFGCDFSDQGVGAQISYDEMQHLAQESAKQRPTPLPQSRQPPLSLCV
jgi:hypothetical protein